MAGRILARAGEWTLTLGSQAFELIVSGRVFAGNPIRLEGARMVEGALWATVALPALDGQSMELRGLPNASAKDLLATIGRVASAARKRARAEAFVREFSTYARSITEWVATTRQACIAELRRRGWLTTEFAQRMLATKPDGFAELIDDPEVLRLIEAHPSREAVDFWRRDFVDAARGINERHTIASLANSAAFFASVESSPLTEEQARAVICFDSRVLLVASAGSGKTSTMVAKAAYALKQGYFKPERILLLAFNNAAAAELRERIVQRFAPLKLSAERVVAKTFHAFGLDVIGQATGRKPTPASWLSGGKDLAALLDMALELRTLDPAFRSQWDLFRIVYWQDLPALEDDGADKLAWDIGRKPQDVWTRRGENVKSAGERVIADWLFFNGVRYEYERPYVHDTADSAHGRYRPDFYLPDIDAWLEHWALDAQGRAPRRFAGYKKSMAWKRALHLQHGTTLLETTTAQLWSGEALRDLEKALTQRGIVLDSDPDREVPGRKPVADERLVQTFRSFLIHAKSNRLSIAELRNRLNTGVAGPFLSRHKLFLDLYAKLRNAWEQRLTVDGCIDFEDMLALAADCISDSRWESPFDLVMVDEFQDASQARARIVNALVAKPDKHLFAVGDDWQSINRFAGADLSVMTDFERLFGSGVTLKLEQTFRCPQSLCNISSRFIQKNPRQLRKEVRAARPDVDEAVRIVQLESEDDFSSAITARLGELADGVPDGSPPLRVYILGRYNDDSKLVAGGHDRKRLKVEFITVHSSKGLEADHVIIARMTSDGRAFPSRQEDDPVLQLAMPSGETFGAAEERRLFYVAMTRSRSGVTIMTLANKLSPFVEELVKDFKLRMVTMVGREMPSPDCPKCLQGFMKPRTGKHGAFWGCSRFPACTWTRNSPPRDQ